MKNHTTRRKCNCVPDPKDRRKLCRLCYGHGMITHEVEVQGDIIIFAFRGHLYTSYGLTDDRCLGDHGIGYEAQWIVGKSLPR